MKKPAQLLIPKQLHLPLVIAKEVEVDGIGMGVLSDGTAYLTGRGLAQMCGIDQKSIVQMTDLWSVVPPNPREARIKQTLSEQGYTGLKPYIALKVNGALHHAFPETVVMALLEYYSFHAGKNIKVKAQSNFRLLALRHFKEFIYSQVGYKPSATGEVWQQYLDRVSLLYNSVPDGYFSIFHEAGSFIVTLIEQGAIIDSTFVPDISIGKCWSTYWSEKGLLKFGKRIEYSHDYPSYFPQAASNPQKPYCYPDEVLGTFRRWMREVYLPEKFPQYLARKVKQGEITAEFKNLALQAFENIKQKKLQPI